MKHGTVGAYNRYGCRCRDCTKAKAEANNKMRNAMKDEKVVKFEDWHFKEFCDENINIDSGSQRMIYDMVFNIQSEKSIKSMQRKAFNYVASVYDVVVSELKESFIDKDQEIEDLKKRIQDLEETSERQKRLILSNSK